MTSKSEAPSPAEIRALRGARSRPEFAELVGVTALTVYRWELPDESPEHRRPRGKVLQRLHAWMQSQGAQPAGSTPAPAVKVAEPPSALEGPERAALAPIISAIEACRLEPAEADLVRLLSAGELRTVAARALASIHLARLQLFARNDCRSAFGTLLALGAEVEHLPRAVQLEFHLTTALLHALPEPQILNVGKTQHHATLAGALLDAGNGDHRFLLWYAQFAAAATLFEVPLLARAMEGFAAAREARRPVHCVAPWSSSPPRSPR